MSKELCSVLRDMAAGRKNRVGDYWGMHHCAEAANVIEALEAEVNELKQTRGLDNQTVTT